MRDKFQIINTYFSAIRVDLLSWAHLGFKLINLPVTCQHAQLKIHANIAHLEVFYLPNNYVVCLEMKSKGKEQISNAAISYVSIKVIIKNLIPNFRWQKTLIIDDLNFLVWLWGGNLTVFGSMLEGHMRLQSECCSGIDAGYVWVVVVVEDRRVVGDVNGIVMEKIVDGVEYFPIRFQKVSELESHPGVNLGQKSFKVSFVYIDHTIPDI